MVPRHRGCEVSIHRAQRLNDAEVDMFKLVPGMHTIFYKYPRKIVDCRQLTATTSQPTSMFVPDTHFSTVSRSAG